LLAAFPCSGQALLLQVFVGLCGREQTITTRENGSF
jgi:hypothetical protein